MTRTNSRELLLNHTREMVTAGMGYALAKLADEPGWLASLNRDGTLGDALAPDVDSFMHARGEIAVDFLTVDLTEPER